MKIEIENLPIDLEQRFQTETSYWHFEIIDVKVTSYDKITITIGHHANKKFKYKFKFNGVYSFQITQESYYDGSHPDEDFYGFSFLQIANNTRFKNDLLNNTLLGDIHSVQEIYKVKTYRLICQNNFIDILTMIEPLVDLDHTEDL